MEERKKISEIRFCKKSSLTFGVAIFFFSAFFLFPVGTEAATMSLSPMSGSYTVGQTFSVGVYVNSPDQSLNAVSGVVSFSKNILEITSVSKSSSILNLWVQEPAFSNGDGNVNFEGIVYNPGFIGNAGKILTITFRAIASSSAFVSFSSATVLANDGAGTNILTNTGRAHTTVLANDGAGTNILTGMERAKFTITGEAPVEPNSFLPGGSLVSSPTHPDTQKWYSTNDPQFEWSLGSDVTGVSFLITRDPTTDPGTKSSGKKASHTYVDVEDGIWYFHIRTESALGWGPATHFPFRIDTEKPTDFTIEELSTSSTYQTTQFIFTATDALSGIEGYEVQIDTEKPQLWYDDGSHTYTTPVLAPGAHSLVVRALDKAGNYIEASTSFVIFAAETSAIVEQVEPARIPLIFLIGGGILLVLLLIFLNLLILYLWHKFKYVRKHLNNSPDADTSVALLEENLNKIFITLRGKIEEYSLLVKKIRLKKKITESDFIDEENKILSDFKEYLDSAERMMRKSFKK